MSPRPSHGWPRAAASSRSPATVGPEEPGWREAFVRLQEKGRVVFTAAVAGQVYARHGTTMDTRLIVVDRIPAEDPRRFPSSPGIAANAAELLDYVGRLVPPRAPVIDASPLPSSSVSALPVRTKAAAPPLALVNRPAPTRDVVELAYEACEWQPAEGARLTAGIYEGYVLQSLRIPDAKPHPTKLVQSAAMAAVAPPPPSYRPHVLPHLLSDLTAFCRMRRSRASSMPAKRIPAISLALIRSTEAQRPEIEILDAQQPDLAGAQPMAVGDQEQRDRAGCPAWWRATGRVRRG
jgi:hypothetical protein